MSERACRLNGGLRPLKSPIGQEAGPAGFKPRVLLFSLPSCSLSRTSSRRRYQRDLIQLAESSIFHSQILLAGRTLIMASERDRHSLRLPAERYDETKDSRILAPLDPSSTCV